MGPKSQIYKVFCLLFCSCSPNRDVHVFVRVCVNFWVSGSQRLVHALWRIVLRACTFVLVDAVSSYASLQVSYFAHTRPDQRDVFSDFSFSSVLRARTSMWFSSRLDAHVHALTFVCFRWLLWPIFSLWSEMIDLFFIFVRCDLG